MCLLARLGSGDHFWKTKLPLQHTFQSFQIVALWQVRDSALKKQGSEMWLSTYLVNLRPSTVQKNDQHCKNKQKF